MRKALKEHIRKNLSDLMKNITWNDQIRNPLISEGIFADNDIQIIEAKTTDFGKSTTMLDILVKRRDGAYATCMEILLNAEQHEAFAILEAGLKTQDDLWREYVARNASSGTNIPQEHGVDQTDRGSPAAVTTSSTPGTSSGTASLSEDTVEPAERPVNLNILGIELNNLSLHPYLQYPIALTLVAVAVYVAVYK